MKLVLLFKCRSFFEVEESMQQETEGRLIGQVIKIDEALISCHLG